MAEVVGTAWVRIRALTTGLAGEIGDAVDKAGPSLDAPAKKIGDRVGKTLGTSASDGIKKSGVGTALPDTLDSPENRSLLSRIGSKLATVFSRSFSQTNDTEQTKQTASWRKHLTSFVDHLKKLKVPVPIWIGYFGMPVIAGLVKTLAYYIGGLVARIGSLLQGLSGVSAAALGLFVQTAAVGALIFSAFKTQTLGLAAFKAEITKVAGAWKEVGAATQQFLLPGVLTSFRDITKSLVPIFKDLGTWVGAVANNTVTAVSALLTGERGMKMWEGFNASTKVTSANLGRITTALARAFIPLMDALNPLAVQFSDAIARLVERWASLLEISSDSGSLRTTLQGWYDTGMKVFGALGDIFAGLWNIMQIGSDASGLAALDRFDQFAERFREWTKSIDGENKIRKFFQEAEPVIREVNGLIADIFRLFFQNVDTGSGSATIVSVLQTLRNEILPKVAEGIKGLTDSFSGDSGENTKNFVSAFGDLIDAFVTAETLIPTIQIITLLLQALVVVLNTPIVGDIVGPLLAVGAAARFLAPITPILTGVWSAISGIASVLGTLIGVAASGGSVIGVLTGAFSNWWVVFSLLHPVLAGIIAAIAPVAAVIAGIAAAVTAAYFAFQPVRDLIDGIWQNFQNLLDLLRNGQWGEALKSLGSLIIKLLIFPFTFAYEAAKGAAEKILQLLSNIPGWLASLGGIIANAVSSAAEAVWSWLTGAAASGGGKISEFFSQIPGWFSGIATTVGTAVAGAASAVWDWLTSAVSLAATKVGEFFAALPGAFANIASEVATAVSGAASSVWDWLVEAVKQAPYRVGYFIGILIGLVIAIPIKLAMTLQAAVTAMVQWVLDAVPGLLSNMASWVSSLWGAISGFVTAIPGQIAGAVGGIVGWLTDAVPALAAKWAEWQSSLWSTIAGFIIALPGQIAGAIGGIVNWLTDAVPALAGKWVEFQTSLWTSIGSFITELPGRILGAAEAILGWIGNAAGMFAGKIEELWTKIWDWVQSLPGALLGALSDVGGQILDGLINGIKSGFGAFGDLASGIKDGIVDAVKGVFSIFSPSKKMMPLGAMITQGLVVGMLNEAQSLGNALDSLIDPLMNNPLMGMLNGSSINTSSMVSAALVSSTPQVGITVKIGDKDITDIVDTQVDKKNTDMARQLVARNG